MAHRGAKKRYQQGWLSELYYDLEPLLDRAEQAKSQREAVSLGFVGNIVDLLEGLIERRICPELGSDQTSLHNPWLGGYMPAGMSFDGGIKAHNVAQVADWGIEVAVVGSGLINDKGTIAENLVEIQQALNA